MYNWNLYNIAARISQNQTQIPILRNLSKISIIIIIIKYLQDSLISVQKPLILLPSVYTIVTCWLWTTIVLCSMIAFSAFSAMTTSGGLQYGAVMYGWIHSRFWKLVYPSLHIASLLIFSCGLHSQWRQPGRMRPLPMASPLCALFIWSPYDAQVCGWLVAFDLCVFISHCLRYIEFRAGVSEVYELVFHRRESWPMLPCPCFSPLVYLLDFPAVLFSWDAPWSNTFSIPIS